MTVEYRAYLVTCTDGPAEDYAAIQFVPPEEAILLMRNHPDMVEKHGAWVHVPDDWLTEGVEVVRYQRGPLPTEDSDQTVTVDGDWLVPYTLMT